MRNQPSIQVLGTDKRFEALLKQEMIEHQHIISSHHKEMQELRDLLKISMERFNSLFEKNQKELSDFKENIINSIATLWERASDNDLILHNQKKVVKEISDQLNKFHDIYESKVSTENSKKEIENNIQQNTKNNLNSWQKLEAEIKILMRGIDNDLQRLSIKTERKLSELSEKNESNFSILRMDKEGVLKEIRIYEKSMFIIEKKIENIYTLIERINKRDEACHKPE